MVAETGGRFVGLVGWQIENLVVRVSDFLLDETQDCRQIGGALVSMIETEAQVLQAEVVLLLLPSHPSPRLLSFWEHLGYQLQGLLELSGPWREAVEEWGLEVQDVMVKRLKEETVRRPV
jgi:hypothetical protein